MTAEEQDIFVDSYLNGDVSEQEFQSAVEANPELKAVLDLHQDVDRYFAFQQQGPYRHMVHSTITGTHKWRFMEISPMLAAAMIALVIGIFFAAYYVLQTPMGPEELFAAHFEPYEPVSFEKRGENTLDEYIRGMQLYGLQNYKEAIPYLESVQGENQLARFYAGISYLALGDSRKAIESLEPLVSHALLQDPARWYLALAYVQMKDLNRAREYLAPLTTNNQSGYRASALELLGDL